MWLQGFVKGYKEERSNADPTCLEGTENGRVMLKSKDCLFAFEWVFFPQQAFQKLIYEIYEMGWAVWLETSFVVS